MESLFYIRPEVKITGNGVNIKINTDNYVIQELDKINDIMITAKSGYISIYALRLMALKNITLSLHNMNGELLYNIIPEYPNKNLGNRLLQYEAYLKNRKSIADKIVKIKQDKYRELLTEYGLPDLTSDNEAVFSNEYFARIGKLIQEYGYYYYSRKGLYRMSNQKAVNIVNATMNLFYGYIEHRLLNAIAYNGLDYNISFLHEPQYNKLPLTYDLIEMLRADIDRIVLEMAKNRKIQRRHFILNKGYYLLKEEKIKSYLKNIETVEASTVKTVNSFLRILE